VKGEGNADQLGGEGSVETSSGTTTATTAATRPHGIATVAQIQEAQAIMQALLSSAPPSLPST
jgi:hypothetical protein